MSQRNLKQVKWLEPWCPFEESQEIKASISEELRRELGKDHVMSGVSCSPVARRRDCDDTLFELLDGTGRFAVVHLTFSGRIEENSRFPETEVYRDWNQFEEKRMKLDHRGWTD